MNEDIVKGKWKQLSGKLKKSWGKLTGDHRIRSQGTTDYLLGELQEHYGRVKLKAQQQLKAIGL